MSKHSALRVGGPADLFYQATDLDEFAELTATAQQLNIPIFVIGHGSNILVSDKGVRALVIYNGCEKIVPGEESYAETGAPFKEVFLKNAQAGLSGLEFAVGIPGTLGGALVSNAGAYRKNIADLLIDLQVVYQGERLTVSPDWMQFSYRDSRLRQNPALPIALLAVRMKLAPRDTRKIFAEAREYQRRRILSQPPGPSVGSFFKNVYDNALAEKIVELPEGHKAAGVVPAGYLIQACGLKGLRLGGAGFSGKHANFILNFGGATASEIKKLASMAKKAVYDKFGAMLEEEALYVGEEDEQP